MAGGADFPSTPNRLFAPIIIATFSLCSVGGHNPGGVAAAGFSSVASAAYPTANKAIYVPFRLSAPIVAVKLFSHNGATVSGNIDVGIYDEQGTRLVSSGSIAQAGTSVLQEFDIADTSLSPGLFYLAVALDNTTATLFRSTPSAIFLRCNGVAEQTSAFALPATATFAAMSSAYLPFVGLSARTLL